MRLRVDLLFALGEDGIDAMVPAAREALDRFADHLRANGQAIGAIEIIGHADWLGSVAINQALSMRRAMAVKRYLQQREVHQHLVLKAMGEADPAVKCADGSSKGQTVACLQPNRRVVVELLTQP